MSSEARSKEDHPTNAKGPVPMPPRSSSLGENTHQSATPPPPPLCVHRLLRRHGDNGGRAAMPAGCARSWPRTVQREKNCTNNCAENLQARRRRGRDAAKHAGQPRIGCSKFLMGIIMVTKRCSRHPSEPQDIPRSFEDLLHKPQAKCQEPQAFFTCLPTTISM